MKVGTAIYLTRIMIGFVILVLIGLIYVGYCVWDMVRSRYRPLKEENEDSKSKEESKKHKFNFNNFPIEV